MGLGLAPPQLQQLHRPLSVEVGQSHVHLYRLGAAAATGADALQKKLHDIQVNYLKIRGRLETSFLYNQIIFDKK